MAAQLLANVVARDPELDVLGFSADPLEIIQMVSHSSPDVLIISARMQDEASRGLILVQQLRAGCPMMKDVVLLDSSKPEMVVQAFRMGASGVFCRTKAVEMLPRCIVAVHRGQIWANSEELQFVISALSDTTHSASVEQESLSVLSKREREVAESIVEGLTNREVAERLGISQHTVKNYVFKIFEKLGASNRVELAVLLCTTLSQQGLS
ncbi:MAG: hypothetical protein DMG62_20070 [Acidobacteria bacterium]|nr:MAG: hypothetical protein DMG62_20070 [Acidobacteriota bacterium]